MFSVSSSETNEVLASGGVPAVQIRMVTPCFSGGSGVAAGRINRFYRRLTEKVLADVRKAVLPEAAKILAAMDDPERFVPFSVQAEYTLTECTEDMVSVFMDFTEKTGPGRGTVWRRADTWSALSGLPVNLKDLFDRGTNVRRECLRLVDSQMDYALSNRTAEYFTNYRRLARRFFRRENFFVQDGTAILFYGQEEIAPRYEGFPLFPVRKLFRGCCADKAEEKGAPSPHRESGGH